MPAIIFQVGISPTPEKGRVLSAESIHMYPAVWSTASNCSRVSEKIIKELGLQPHLEKRDDELRYSLDIHLPNKIRISLNDVGIMDPSIVKGQAQCLIGMDVIRQGDISISHSGNKGFFSFRAPTMGGIDYAQEIASQKESLPSTTMVSRNQLCTCGSGKKYKNCCGKL